MSRALKRRFPDKEDPAPKRIKSENEPLPEEKVSRSLEIIRHLDESVIREHLFPRLVQDRTTSQPTLDLLSFTTGSTRGTLLHNKKLSSVDIDLLRLIIEALLKSTKTGSATISALSTLPRFPGGSKIIKEAKLQIAAIVVNAPPLEEFAFGLDGVISTVGKLRMFKYAKWEPDWERLSDELGRPKPPVVDSKLHALHLLRQVAENVPLKEVKANGLKEFPAVTQLFEHLDLAMLSWLEVCHEEARVWTKDEDLEDRHFDVGAILGSLNKHREKLPGCMWAIYFRKSIAQLEVWERQQVVIDGCMVFDMRTLRAYSHFSNPEAEMLKTVEKRSLELTVQPSPWWDD